MSLSSFSMPHPTVSNLMRGVEEYRNLYSLPEVMLYASSQDEEN